MGAREAVGIDISPAIIDAAQNLSTTDAEREKIEFVIADCSQPLLGSLFVEPFDLVIAFCFLNYATEEAGIFGMWQVIAANLHSDTKIIALVPNLELQDDFFYAD
ncbi:hypothetical protein H2198_009933 [Neophaeococcomyces mojaviensis]|uniref:Uncharacterized protein n=1 Tax=Neophaeococcomyces mojaviensis TaxID=3383035 RepID=A0ACC2ZT25_9EURO|nr:hypothetical protein H2198_009933 [Knufia sp. JES_112]